MSDEVSQSEAVASEESDATEAFDDRSEAERQRDEYLDALQRLQAEFENYRKRVARTAEDAANRANADFVAKLLPVLDSFDYAQTHFADAQSAEARALDATRALLLDTLTKEGLERIELSDVAFDPQIHDAVAHAAHEEGDERGAIVEDVLRAGYRWKGVVVRPAMVKVRG
ncbi:MAG TPA: nucleotide exchange factor GrpE [Acidimicrobiales bacterium]|jgi:molecular chaperone GrpE